MGNCPIQIKLEDRSFDLRSEVALIFLVSSQDKTANFNPI
jgi:hypothetical protein